MSEGVYVNLSCELSFGYTVLNVKSGHDYSGKTNNLFLASAKGFHRAWVSILDRVRNNSYETKVKGGVNRFFSNNGLRLRIKILAAAY